MAIVAAAAAGVGAAPAVRAIGENREGKAYPADGGGEPIPTPAGWTWEAMRGVMKAELEKNLTIWREHGIDLEHGGFLPHIRPYVDETGKVTNAEKLIYHQGRVLWLYSYLYNHYGHDAAWLEKAKTGHDFLVEHARIEGDLWATRLTPEGEVMIGFYDVLACAYMVMGLGEYHRATGLAEPREMAVATARRLSGILHSGGYQAQGHGPRDEFRGEWMEPGTRRMGAWLHFLSALTPLLRHTPEPSLEVIARRLVRNILEYHYQPDLELPLEFLAWDFKPYPESPLNQEEEWYRIVDGFHSIEAAWMSMDEAMRIGAPEVFTRAEAMGRKLIEKTWHKDENRWEGLVRYYQPGKPDPWVTARVLPPYVMNELWVYLLLSLEQSGGKWAAERLGYTFSLCYEKDGTPKVEFPYGETLHHPRGLLYGIKILDRVIERGGKRSAFLA